MREREKGGKGRKGERKREEVHLVVVGIAREWGAHEDTILQATDLLLLSPVSNKRGRGNEGEGKGKKGEKRREREKRYTW
jgi:hypothetical protein